MKLKVKLKSFWRHNKKYHEMYFMSIMIVLMAIPPIIVVLLPFEIGIILAWFILWQRSVRIDILRRTLAVQSYRYKKIVDELIDNSNKIIEEAQRENARQREEIERMQKLLSNEQD